MNDEEAATYKKRDRERHVVIELRRLVKQAQLPDSQVELLLPSHESCWLLGHGVFLIYNICWALDARGRI
jgi:hypothetical protein